MVRIIHTTAVGVNQVLPKPSCTATVKGGRRLGKQEKRWEEDNIRKWTGLEFAKSQKAVESRENGGIWL